MKFAIFAALMAIAMPAPAVAADWVFIGDSVSEKEIYVDLQSIRTMPNGYKRAWNKIDFTKAHKDGYTSVKGYVEYDCIEKRRRSISLIFFKGKQASTTSNEVGEWNYSAPESISESLLEFVCRK